MNLRPMTAEERKYSYDQSNQLTGQTGCIGCLSGTLDAEGRFAPAWKDCRTSLNTDEFGANRDIALQALRHEGCILENRERMLKRRNIRIFGRQTTVSRMIRYHTVNRILSGKQFTVKQQNHQLGKYNRRKLNPSILILSRFRNHIICKIDSQKQHRPALTL